MAKVTKETAAHVARLACLKFQPKQLEVYAERFARVLKYVEKLNEVDTKGIEPTSQTIASPTVPLRDDMTAKSAGIEAILSNVPAKDGRLVKVPKVIE